jgi:hypothetical protein
MAAVGFARRIRDVTRYALLAAALATLTLACGGESPSPSPSGPSATAPNDSSPPAGMTTATTLSSFEGSEEPEVLYYPSSGTFKNDAFANMTNASPGTMRFVLRYRYASEGWWDGDRTTTNDDRQRAEVKGLGAHQKNGETFEYGTTWRTSRGGAGKFWHVFQLKATDGDDDAPLIVNSIQSASGAAFRYWPGTASNFIVARSYTFAVDAFTTIRIRVRTSTAADGEVRGSVNGDALAGATAVAVYRPQSTDYRPKWGSYRGVGTGEPYGDDTVEHRDVWAGKVR